LRQRRQRRSGASNKQAPKQVIPEKPYLCLSGVEIHLR
jgi:hypothetical protein